LSFSNPFSDRLKEARTKTGISQKELGIKIGMEPSSASGRMNHYEKGRHFPDISTLKRLADALDVPLNYFFCESDDMAKLVLSFHSLTEIQKRELLEELNGSGKPLE